MQDLQEELQFYKIGSYGFDQFFQLSEHLNPIDIFDTIKIQLAELVKLNNPSQKLGEDEIEAKIAEHTKNILLEKYGNWVFYPWSKRLVHVLPEDEFVEVRTIRNKYKISSKEQELLKKKKVGVVGLSVGQSVAVTMAMERIGGTFRLADFDHLELANMNRLRSGVHDIGLTKTSMVAREISEMDPYLNIETFSKGVTKKNIDAFIGEGDDQLDLIIDECDSLDIKILLRQKAREKNIPLLMDTSDRGMLDIERHEKENQYPLFHGLIKEDEIDIIMSGKASETQRLEIVKKILDVNTMSHELKTSLTEIGKSITTWPQLASSVALGGGAAAIAARNILLDRPIKSGRYFIDVDEIIMK